MMTTLWSSLPSPRADPPSAVWRPRGKPLTTASVSYPFPRAPLAPSSPSHYHQFSSTGMTCVLWFVYCLTRSSRSLYKNTSEVQRGEGLAQRDTGWGMRGLRSHTVWEMAPNLSLFSAGSLAQRLLCGCDARARHFGGNKVRVKQSLLC